MYNETGIVARFSNLNIMVLACEIRAVMVEKVKWKTLKQPLKQPRYKIKTVFFGKDSIWWIMEISVTLTNSVILKNVYLIGQSGPCGNCMDPEGGL